jgi:hypothetical protein
METSVSNDVELACYAMLGVLNLARGRRWRRRCWKTTSDECCENGCCGRVKERGLRWYGDKCFK